MLNNCSLVNNLERLLHTKPVQKWCSILIRSSTCRCVSARWHVFKWGHANFGESSLVMRHTFFSMAQNSSARVVDESHRHHQDQRNQGSPSQKWKTCWSHYLMWEAPSVCIRQCSVCENRQGLWQVRSWLLHQACIIRQIVAKRTITILESPYSLGPAHCKAIIKGAYFWRRRSSQEGHNDRAAKYLGILPAVHGGEGWKLC